ncbi:hypothetical protein [Longispora fulva]|uniref:DUF5666 domain-containing protein n=1 Tax=Longispora fulva TaxID=619741 RepID=A0A8J7GMH5_9ACTN|nr:hypothetical protein [Longispora fulva]MBG6135779.1 hypothetical protein [Longispora fulva]
MRRLLALAAATLLLAGCANSTPAGAGSPRAATPSAQAHSAPSPSGPTSHSNATEESPKPEAGRSAPANPPADQPTGDPQLVDPVGPPRTLTGTVSSIAGCRVLDADSGRWALLGASAGELRDGDRVTVRGRPAKIPAGCMVDHALTVQLVTR